MSKYLLYVISEQYANDIATYRFLYSLWFDLWQLLSSARKNHIIFFVFFLFCFPVGPNPTIFDKTRFLIPWNLDYKIDWFEVFVLNSLLKLLGKSQVWITSRLVYVLTITHFARNMDLILTILLKYSFSWLLLCMGVKFPKSFCCSIWIVNSNLLNLVYW